MEKMAFIFISCFFIVPSIFASGSKYNHLLADRSISFNDTYEIDRFI